MPESLRHVSFTEPGIRRVRSGHGFRYLNPDGQANRSQEDLARIRFLAIPPAWTDVWICRWANGHLQAVGRDAGGRRQYLYHPLWKKLRDQAKFDELLEIARVLPALRRQVREDLRLPGLPRAKVLAAVVWLLERTLIRVGNEEYAEEHHAYGLTTLEDRHVLIKGLRICFSFVGKSGRFHVVRVRAPRLARVVKECQELPGQVLFQYVDAGGVRQDVGSEDVNAYLGRFKETGFTAKDFRTWAATVEALAFLRQAGPATDEREARRTMARCLGAVSARLGNTVAVCRQSYVHPEVLLRYASGELESLCVERPGERQPRGLHADERLAVTFLRRLRKRVS